MCRRRVLVHHHLREECRETRRSPSCGTVASRRCRSWGDRVCPACKGCEPLASSAFSRTALGSRATRMKSEPGPWQRCQKRRLWSSAEIHRLVEGTAPITRTPTRADPGFCVRVRSVGRRASGRHPAPPTILHSAHPGQRTGVKKLFPPGWPEGTHIACFSDQHILVRSRICTTWRHALRVLQTCSLWQRASFLTRAAYMARAVRLCPGRSPGSRERVAGPALHAEGVLIPGCVPRTGFSLLYQVLLVGRKRGSSGLNLV